MSPPIDVPAPEGAPAEPPRRPVAAISAAIVAVALLGLFLVFANAGGGGGADRRATVGQRIALSGPTLSGGTYDLADRRGSFVLVNFFATWCTPCKLEHPELVKFSREYAGTGEASVVSVAYEDSEEELRAFFEQNGGDWPVMVGEGTRRAATEFGVVKLPESYLVDPSGTVIEKFVGGVTADEVEAAMQQASTKAPS